MRGIELDHALDNRGEAGEEKRGPSTQSSKPADNNFAAFPDAETYPAYIIHCYLSLARVATCSAGHHVA